MKSLLFTAFLSAGVGHTGAFLGVWTLPYAENHFSLSDLTRKLNAVTKWSETTDSLRNKRDQAAADNYALYDRSSRGPQSHPTDSRVYQPRKNTQNRSTSSK